MSETDNTDPLTFSTQEIEFEPSTGYVGNAVDFIPEPITSMHINAYVKVDSGRVLEGYWLCASDASGLVPDPQPIMHTSDFVKIARLCAIMFEVCGCADAEEIKVGLGFTAYHNEMARRLDPDLPEGPVHNLACSVSGYPRRGVLVRFSTADAAPTQVAAVRGCLAPQGMHTLARSFRDMVEWRLAALDQAAELAARRGSVLPEPGMKPAQIQTLPQPKAPGRM